MSGRGGGCSSSGQGAGECGGSLGAWEGSLGAWRGAPNAYAPACLHTSPASVSLFPTLRGVLAPHQPCPLPLCSRQANGGGSPAAAGSVWAEAVPLPLRCPAQAPGLAAGGGGAGHEDAQEVGAALRGPLCAPLSSQLGVGGFGPHPSTVSGGLMWVVREAICALPFLPHSSFRDEPMLLPKTPSQRRKLRRRQSSWMREENKELSRRR